MPRKQRCRWIEGYPDHWEFSPEEVSTREPVVMTLDEFETIRLLDREGLTQEQCAEKMGIARTTVTAIYESARRKVASALVDGKQLLIRGGNYRLNDQGTENIIQKGTENMRIAVTYENGEVFSISATLISSSSTMWRMVRSLQSRSFLRTAAGTAHWQAF